MKAFVPDKVGIFIAVVALFLVALAVGFVVGVVMVLAGQGGYGLVWSCGMPLLAMVVASTNSRC